MTIMVQIRNVPDELASELKARAAARRQNLSDYLLAELEQIVATPSLGDLLARLAARPRRDLGVTAAELLDEARAEQ